MTTQLKKIKFVSVIFTSIILLQACTSSGGFQSEQSHFDFPNSDVIPLGNVKAVYTDASFFSCPVLTKEIILNILEEALAKHQNSDLIIDYYLNTTYTRYPFYCEAETVLEGTAANMKVFNKKIWNDAEYK